jgi:hypothetical protein
MRLPVSLAWETFGEANGATSLEEVRGRISKYRRPIERGEDPQIGCIRLEEPFFFDWDNWMNQFLLGTHLEKVEAGAARSPGSTLQMSCSFECRGKRIRYSNVTP